MQIIAASAEELRAARCGPEKYREPIVILRVGGFSAYYTELASRLGAYSVFSALESSFAEAGAVRVQKE